MAYDKDCIFCKIAAGEIPSTKVFEDETILAFMDINPVGRGHLLVIPKDHFPTVYEMDPQVLTELFKTAQKLAKAQKKALDMPGLNLIQSNGRAASQVIDHFHLHLIPRWPGDAFAQAMAWELKPGDMADIAATAEKIKKEL